jgi:hypothetical protein
MTLCTYIYTAGIGSSLYILVEYKICCCTYLCVPSASGVNSIKKGRALYTGMVILKISLHIIRGCARSFLNTKLLIQIILFYDETLL